MDILLFIIKQEYIKKSSVCKILKITTQNSMFNLKPLPMI